jgi:hypothetical protein
MHFLNFYVLQWLFIRLCRVQSDESDGGKFLGWGIVGLVPLSGYFGSPCKSWRNGFLLYFGK